MSTQSELELLPIDIHYNKLSDWLISRRHCQQQWQAAALTIREKINEAIQDMPPVEYITQLLQGTYINYFHCLRIVELLKETEKGTKNIFGSYSSKRMKDWQEIVKLYETNGVGLAEAAQMLTRYVNYEIPSVKKQISRCKQQQKDCLRKEGEYSSLASEMKAKFQASCKEMGIEGKKIKHELLGLIRELPEIYQSVTKSCQSIEPAVNYYAAFIDFTLDKKHWADECCPLIRHLLSKGNTTTHEWRTGVKPARVVEDNPFDGVIDAEEEDLEESTEGGIDFGEAIDYGIELEVSGENIDFGDDICYDVDTENPGEVINFDLGSVEDAGKASEGETSTIVSGEDAQSLLDNPSTRNIFVDELMELEAFLTQRQSEASNTAGVLTTSQFSNAPKTLQVELLDIQEMISHVQSIISRLSSVKMHHLFLIRGSPRYVDRLAESLKGALGQSEKAQASQRLMVQRRAEVAEEEIELLPKLDLLRVKTKELQKQIEHEISEKYKNRPVNIMGEINSV